MGYYQIKHTPRALEGSAFVTEDGQWEFLRMLYGMCNAPATIQQAMQEIFQDHIGRFMSVYFDDITIYSST